MTFSKFCVGTISSKAAATIVAIGITTIGALPPAQAATFITAGDILELSGSLEIGGTQGTPEYVDYLGGADRDTGRLIVTGGSTGGFADLVGNSGTIRDLTLAAFSQGPNFTSSDWVQVDTDDAGDKLSFNLTNFLGIQPVGDKVTVSFNGFFSGIDVTGATSGFATLMANFSGNDLKMALSGGEPAVSPFLLTINAENNLDTSSISRSLLTTSEQLIANSEEATAMPSPAMLPGLIGMGLATLRKRRSQPKQAAKN
jgi:hypothetical protein